jgi:hypothetical protein
MQHAGRLPFIDSPMVGLELCSAVVLLTLILWSFTPTCRLQLPSLRPSSWQCYFWCPTPVSTLWCFRPGEAEAEHGWCIDTPRCLTESYLLCCSTHCVVVIALHMHLLCHMLRALQPGNATLSFPKAGHYTVFCPVYGHCEWVGDCSSALAHLY